VKLVFDDWRRWVPDGSKDESIYNTEEGMELSTGSLHSGSTFKAVVELSDDDAARLSSAMSTGIKPVFYAVPDSPCVLKRKPRKYITGPLVTGRRKK
jgi:hypothetical protein